MSHFYTRCLKSWLKFCQKRAEMWYKQVISRKVTIIWNRKQVIKVVIVAVPSGTRFFHFANSVVSSLFIILRLQILLMDTCRLWFMIYWSVMAISGADAAVVGRWIWIYWSFKSHCTVIRVDNICQRSCTVTVGCWEFWQRGILQPREGLLFTQAIDFCITTTVI